MPVASPGIKFCFLLTYDHSQPAYKYSSHGIHRLFNLVRIIVFKPLSLISPNILGLRKKPCSGCGITYNFSNNGTISFPKIGPFSGSLGLGFYACRTINFPTVQKLTINFPAAITF